MSNTCPACQTENRIGARFCKRCATPLTDEATTIVAPAPAPAPTPVAVVVAGDTGAPPTCPACGYACTAGARFCGQCGASLRAGATAGSPPQPPDAQVEPAALASRLGGVALAITLALLLLAGWFWSMQRGSVDGAATPASAAGMSTPAGAPAASASPPAAVALPGVTLEVVAEPVAPAIPAATAPAQPPGQLQAPGPAVRAGSAASPPAATLLPPAVPGAPAAPATSVEPAAPASAPGVADPQAAAPPAAEPPPAQRPRAATAARPAEAPRQAVREAAVARASNSPDAACATSSNFTRPFCVSVQCVKAQFRDHPSCVQLRDQERQRQELERANGTDG